MPPRMPGLEQEVDFRELAQEVRARLREMDRKLDMLSNAVIPMSDNKLLPHIPEALLIQPAWIPKSPRGGTSPSPRGGTPEPETHGGDTGHAHFGKTVDMETEPNWEPEPAADGFSREEADVHWASKGSEGKLESEDEAEPLPVVAEVQHARFCSSPDRSSKIPNAVVEKVSSNARKDPEDARPSSTYSRFLSQASGISSLAEDAGKKVNSRSRQTSNQKFTSEALTKPRNRPPLLSRIYMFMEDAESSRMAHWYSVFMPVFTLTTVWITLLQTHRPPVLDGIPAAALETLFDLVFTTEFLLRFMTCPSYRAFFRCGYNLIDLGCVVPLFLRAAIGFRISSEKETAASSILLCIVPLVRLLKTLRRFQEIQLLWAAFKNALEALPVLMFTALAMNLLFSALIFLIEPRWNIPTFGSAMWMTIVTMMTIGYGDITPKSDVGSIVVSVLIVCSVLYMAMPLGIVGQMFSQVWEQRDRILLMKRTRAALIQWGYQAHDIPMLFDLFDTDGDGYLTLEEFQHMIEFLDIGMSRSRVGRLFDTFDVDGGGTVSDAEFVRGLFPSEYHELFAPVGHKDPHEHQEHQAELHARATVMKMNSLPNSDAEPNGDHKRRTSQHVVVRGRRGSAFVSRKYDAALPNSNVRHQAEAFAAKGHQLSIRSSFSHSLSEADEEDDRAAPPPGQNSDEKTWHSSKRRVSFSQERARRSRPNGEVG